MMPRARKEWVWMRGRPPAKRIRGSRTSFRFSKANRKRRYRQGNRNAHPKRVARWGMSMSTMGLTHLRPIRGRLVGVT